VERDGNKVTRMVRGTRGGNIKAVITIRRRRAAVPSRGETTGAIHENRKMCKKDKHVMKMS